MGDRGNIAMVFDKERTQQVWIYSHWGGSDLPELLKVGLSAGKSRWGDDSYLARIILCNVIPANQLAETTGFGISCTMQDNEHPILVVDMPTKTSVQDARVESGQAEVERSRGLQTRGKLDV